MKTPVTHNGANKEPTYLSTDMYFIRHHNERQLQTVRPTFPRKKNIEAIRFDSENFCKCLSWSKNPFQADVQKLSPETAMYAYALSLR